MRPLFTASLVLASSCLAFNTYADNLNDLYQAAVKNDPIMQAAEAQYRADTENKNIAKGALLPQISFDVTAGYQDSKTQTTLEDPRNGTSLAGAESFLNSHSKGYGFQDISITLTQQLLNMSAWYTFKGGQELT